MLATGLGRAALLVAGLHLIHDLDHVRQGGRDSIGDAVPFLVAVAWLSTLALLWLVARRHRLAPAFAVPFGVAFALGFVVVHLLPDWGAFSDSYQVYDPDALSWALAVVPVLAGLWLAYEGYRNRSWSGGRTSAAAMPGPS